MPDILIKVLSTILALGILIFVHELGHFLFAKLFRVGVKVFSLGFGAKLLSWQYGETEYRISAFPLGGYVKMVGEAVDEELPAEEIDRSFMAKSPYRRMIIVAAGPAFNLIFAYLVFVVLCLTGIPTPTTKIGSVLKDQPAARAGILPGDRILAINGKSIAKWDELNTLVGGSGGKALDFKVQRGEATFSVKITPALLTLKNDLNETIIAPKIGVRPSAETVTERFGPLQAMAKGGELSWNVIQTIVTVIYKILVRDIPPDIGSFLTIGDVVGEQAKVGVMPFLSILALLSINLGVLNLLPIPILDGGHIVFSLWEIIFRKPVGMRTREIAQQVGLVLLLALMAFALYKDFSKYLLPFLTKQG